MDQIGGQFFLASFRMGSALTGKNVVFIVDPEGTPHATPDQVELTTWSDVDVQPWVDNRNRPFREEAPVPLRVQELRPRQPVSLESQAIGKARPFADEGAPRWPARGAAESCMRDVACSWCLGRVGRRKTIQQVKQLDPDFAVILPAATKAGDTVQLLTVYSGKDALRSDGNGTYFLMGGARTAGIRRVGAGLETFHISTGPSTLRSKHRLSRQGESQPDAGVAARYLRADR